MSWPMSLQHHCQLSLTGCGDGGEVPKGGKKNISHSCLQEGQEGEIQRATGCSASPHSLER